MSLSLQASGVVGTPPSSCARPAPVSAQPTAADALCLQVVRLTWWAVCRDSVYYTLSVVVLIAVSSPPTPEIAFDPGPTPGSLQHPAVGCADHALPSHPAVPSPQASPPEIPHLPPQ